MFLVCHVILQDHVIKKSYDFMGGIPTWKVQGLSERVGQGWLVDRLVFSYFVNMLKTVRYFPTAVHISMGLGPNWYQIGNKTCYIRKVSKFYAEKEHLC